jgi:hypothetical protein
MLKGFSLPENMAHDAAPFL